jgi:alkyl sulfatase BDS1-like metallo-beta-lactamase superfamily hydrolase
MGKQSDQKIIPPESSMLDQIPIDMFFDVLRVNLDPNKIDSDEKINVCFNFSSGITKSMIIRNQIAQITNHLLQNCSINVRSDDLLFKEVLAGIKNPLMEIANGNLIVDQDVKFLQLLMSFRP